MRPDIVSGALFPDYELSDHHGMRRTISALQGGDPLVLVLSRGGFCPKERRQHEGLLQLHREMQVGYCRLSPSQPTTCSRPMSSAPALSLFRFQQRRLRSPQQIGPRHAG